MPFYLGYATPDAGYLRERSERARRAGLAGDELAARRTRGLPGQLPPTVRLLASYIPSTYQLSSEPVTGPSFPAIFVYEADALASLRMVNQYYAGFIHIEWVEAISLGTTAAEREAMGDLLRDL
jgi:hypothetical protein